MLSAAKEKPPVQRFFSPLENRTVSIEAQVDAATGTPFILWKHIQRSFKGRLLVRAGEIDVQFMVDSDYQEVEPLRIRLYPDEILQVVQDQVPLPDSSTVNDVKPDAGPRERRRKASYALTRQPSTLLTETDLGKSLVHCSKHMTSHGQDCAASFPILYESFAKAMMAGQDQQIESIKTRMDADMNLMLVSLMEKMDRNQAQLLEKDRENKELLEKIIEMEKDMKMRQASMTEKMEKNQAQLLEKDRENKEMQKQIHGMQEETLNRLAVIQSRVQAILTQTYELFEYPIPRLFVVLPKERESWDKVNPFTHKFKVYFLCECGDHTKKKSSSPSKMPHHIHLAKHPGYDLLRPTEFFEKYGHYLLTMMEMIKFGIAAAGVVVPTLAQLGVLDGIEEVKNQLDFTEKTFAPLLDGSILYVKNHIDQDLPDADLEGRNDLIAQEALEGADLRQLSSYLSKADEARTLGNLYRTVTEEGHVKWVCFDHYRDGYMESIQRRFAEIVTTNGGKFVEDLGQVEIELSTRPTAQEFYDALKQTKGVQELIIYPRWDATKSDIQQLCDTIFESNVSILTVNGYYFNSPTSDVRNRGSRFDPFIQMIARGKLQSFTFKECPRFFDRISDIASLVIPTLRALHLDYYIKEKESKSTTQTVVNLLRRFPNLIETTVICSDIDEIFELLPIQRFPQLSILHLERRGYGNKATLQLLKGTMRHVDMWVRYIPKLAYSGFLREFEMVEDIIPLPDLKRLLGANMGLTKLRLMMPEDTFECIFLIDTLMSTRRSPLLVVMESRIGSVAKMEFWNAAKVPPSESTGKWIQLPHSMVHIQVWRNMRFSFQQMNINMGMFLSGLEEMAHDTDEVKLDLDMSLLNEAGIRVIQKAMASLRPKECSVIFKEYKQEWAHCYDFDPVCWSRLWKLKVSGEDMVAWLQRPGSVFKRELMPSLQYPGIEVQGSEAILSGSFLANWLTSMVSSNEAFQPLLGLQISKAHFSHEDWRTILGSIDYSSLGYMLLDGCDLAGAFPGSPKDQEYNAAGLCRHFGLGTEHQEQAAGLLLGKIWNDYLEFSRIY